MLQALAACVRRMRPEGGGGIIIACRDKTQAQKGGQRSSPVGLTPGPEWRRGHCHRAHAPCPIQPIGGMKTKPLRTKQLHLSAKSQAKA